MNIKIDFHLVDLITFTGLEDYKVMECLIITEEKLS